MEPEGWISEERDDDARVLFRIGRRSDGLVAEFAGIGTLSATRDGGVSSFDPAPGADPVLVQKTRSGVASALLRHLAGKITLHGCAVAWGDSAIACVGESRVGKSTLAARLCEEHGGALVSDDTTAIEFESNRVELSPTERVHWLIARQANETGALVDVKGAVTPRACAQGRPQLAAVCHLVFDDTVPDVSLRRLRGHHALEPLISVTIRFVLDEPSMQEREFEQLNALADRVPVYELRRPHSMHLLDPSCRTLLALLGSNAAVAHAQGELS